jgi:NADH-quinone oxidoreductase subunit M
MLTAFLIFWPVAAALLVWLSGSKLSRGMAFAATLIQLIVTITALAGFDPNGGVQQEINQEWIPGLGIHFHIGMDGISMLLVLLTNVLLPLIVLSSFKFNYKTPSHFYALALIMQSALVGVFTSLDGFLFYIFWEMALVPIYFIVLIWGGEKRAPVTFKFFIYTLTGSLFMLIGMIYLYLQTPAPHSFDLTAITNLGLDIRSQGFIFWAFFLAFAIKMPVFPFHTWQPDTYVEASPQGTMLLSGIMLKMGIYGAIRWLMPTVPAGMIYWQKTVIILAVAGIVYASWIAVTRKDLKRLFAYSSIAHVGLIAAGIFTVTVQGLQGGMIQMFSHGINVVGLFFAAQIIFDRMQTNNIPSLGGIVHRAPIFSTLFFIILLGSIALPLTNGFIGEFLLLKSVYDYNIWLSVLATLTIILSAWYMLKMYQHSIFGELKDVNTAFRDLSLNEGLVMGTLAALVLLIGIYPKPLLDLTEPAVRHLVESIYPQNLTLK